MLVRPTRLRLRQIPLIYPPSACESPIPHLRSLLEKRTPRHRKGAIFWLAVSPLTAPFMIISTSRGPRPAPHTSSYSHAIVPTHSDHPKLPVLLLRMALVVALSRYAFLSIPRRSREHSREPPSARSIQGIRVPTEPPPQRRDYLTVQPGARRHLCEIRASSGRVSRV